MAQNLQLASYNSILTPALPRGASTQATVRRSTTNGRTSRSSWAPRARRMASITLSCGYERKWSRYDFGRSFCCWRRNRTFASWMRSPGFRWFTGEFNPLESIGVNWGQLKGSTGRVGQASKSQRSFLHPPHRTKGSIDNLDNLLIAGIHKSDSVVVVNNESTNDLFSIHLADCNTIVAVQSVSSFDCLWFAMVHLSIAFSFIVCTFTYLSHFCSPSTRSPSALSPPLPALLCGRFRCSKCSRAFA